MIPVNQTEQTSGRDAFHLIHRKKLLSYTITVRMIDSVFAIIDFYDFTDIFIYIIPLKCNGLSAGGKDILLMH